VIQSLYLWSGMLGLERKCLVSVQVSVFSKCASERVSKCVSERSSKCVLCK